MGSVVVQMNERCGGIWMLHYRWLIVRRVACSSCGWSRGPIIGVRRAWRAAYRHMGWDPAEVAR